MKLRLKGNTVRFRLTQGEVATLGSSGHVAESTALDGGTFSYELRSAPVREPQIELQGTVLVVKLPEGLVSSWVETDEVGIYATSGVGEEAVSLTVEKDFQCLTPRPGGEDADAYPHPSGDTGHG